MQGREPLNIIVIIHVQVQTKQLSKVMVEKNVFFINNLLINKMVNASTLLFVFKVRNMLGIFGKCNL